MGKTQVKRPVFQQVGTRFVGAIGLILSVSTVFCGSAYAETPPPQPGPALWRIADDDTELYLLGTIHVLPQGLGWQRDVITENLLSADKVYFETSPNDPTSGSTFEFLKAGMAGPGESVHDVLSAEQFEVLSEALDEVGLRIDTFKGQKPWLAALMLSVNVLEDSGHYAEFGVETWIENQLDGDLTIRSLESGVTVANSLSAMPMEAQIAMLMDGLEDAEADDAPDDVESVMLSLKAWLKGRPELIFDLVAADMKTEMPELYDVMFTSRNAHWTNKLDQMMRKDEGRIFIAVGAGHLTGPDSVLVMMSERGWSVERL